MSTWMKFILIIILLYILFVMCARKVHPLYLTEHMTGKLYSLMEQIDKVLRENEISYFIVGGTLLGAVRNKKIIPWDDDIDIAILKKDLDRFKRLNWEFYNLEYHGINNGNKVRKIAFKNTFHGKATKMKDIFVDIFVYEKEGDKYVFSDQYSRKAWEDDYLTDSELYPLKEYDLDSLHVLGPHNPYPYLSRTYGDWNKTKFTFIKTIIYPLEAIASYRRKPYT